jgi:hypothetical protein
VREKEKKEKKERERLGYRQLTKGYFTTLETISK